MKKWTALLLCLVMLCTSTALAESIGEIDGRNFSVTPPEGYTVEPIETENGVLAVISADDPEKTRFCVSVVHSEFFAGYTMDMENMTEEQYQQMIEKLTSDFDSPEIQVFTSEDGRSAIYVDEQGAASDYAFLFTVVQGYCAEVDLFKAEGQINEDEIRTAREILVSVRAE